MAVRAAAQRVARWWWMLAGFVCVGVGGVGIVVPGLPTTVFFVMAAWCFSRSSPRFERWVLGLPTIGPMVRDYRAGLGMPLRAKQWAVSMIVVAVLLSAFLTRDRPWVAAIILVAGAVGGWFVAWHIPTRKTALDEHHRRAAPPT